MMALVAIISLIVMPVYADHSADNDVLGTDDEDESAFSDSYSMDVREVNIDTGEVSEFSIDVPEPQIQPLSDEESPWEQIVRLAGAEGKHPMEYLADLQADMPTPAYDFTGTKTRVKDTTISPYDGIVYLGLTYSNSNFEYTGTGVWIASNKILTCAHNLEPIGGGVHFQIESHYGQKWGCFYLREHRFRFHDLSCSCFMGKNGSFPAGDDYCIITVEKPGKHGTFSLNSSLSSSKTYTLCGYEYISGNNRYQTKDSGSVSVKSGSNSKQLTYKIYGGPGRSGAERRTHL